MNIINEADTRLSSIAPVEEPFTVFAAAKDSETVREVLVNLGIAFEEKAPLNKIDRFRFIISKGNKAKISRELKTAGATAFQLSEGEDCEEETLTETETTFRIMAGQNESDTVAKILNDKGVLYQTKTPVSSVSRIEFTVSASEEEKRAVERALKIARVSNTVLAEGMETWPKFSVTLEVVDWLDLEDGEREEIWNKAVAAIKSAVDSVEYKFDDKVKLKSKFD